MRRLDRGDLLLAGAGAMILGAAALYASLVWSWLSDRPASSAVPAPVTAKVDTGVLAAARQSYRDAFLDARSWLRLSEALARAGRPIDSFYVLREARAFFSEDAFRKAHASVIQRRDPAALDDDAGPEQEPLLKTRLQSDLDNPGLLLTLARLQSRAGRSTEANRSLDLGLTAHPQNGALLLAKGQLSESTDPLAAIPFYARAAHASPDRYEGRFALERLGQLAGTPELGPRGESARLAREALEELRRAHPGDAAIFATLGLALGARGDMTTMRALALEAGRKEADNPGVAMLEGALALNDRETDLAIQRFTTAWEHNPEDVYSAEKLALIYSQQRGDEEAALPYRIALFRRDPARRQGGELLDVLIRRTLDARRKALLKNVTVEGLGRFLQSEDASLRAEACERAAAFKDPRWIEVVAELLDDDAEIVRRNADYALYQLGKLYPDALQVRRDAWLTSERPLLRARALNLFADLWPQETLPLALRALQDPNPALRYLTKTLVLDRYYRGVPAAQRGAAESMAQEKNPLMLERYDDDKRRARAQP